MQKPDLTQTLTPVTRQNFSHAPLVRSELPNLTHTPGQRIGPRLLKGGKGPWHLFKPPNVTGEAARYRPRTFHTHLLVPASFHGFLPSLAPPALTTDQAQPTERGQDGCLTHRCVLMEPE